MIAGRGRQFGSFLGQLKLVIEGKVSDSSAFTRRGLNKTCEPAHTLDMYGGARILIFLDPTKIHQPQRRIMNSGGSQLEHAQIRTPTERSELDGESREK